MANPFDSIRSFRESMRYMLINSYGVIFTSETDFSEWVVTTGEDNNTYKKVTPFHLFSNQELYISFEGFDEVRMKIFADLSSELNGIRNFYGTLEEGLNILEHAEGFSKL